MKQANVAELKANLSRYLRAVRRGETVIVCDRNRPVARLVPMREGAQGFRERAIESGLILPGSRVGQAPRPPRTYKGRGDAIGALLADRYGE
jgi:prevent-host-death family protein